MRCVVLLVSSGAGAPAVTPSCCSTASQRHCNCRARRRGPPAVAGAPRAPSSRAAAGQAAWRPTLQLTSSAMAAGRRDNSCLMRHHLFSSVVVRRQRCRRPAARQGARDASVLARSSCKPSPRSAARREQPPLRAPRCRSETGLALAVASLSLLYPQWLRLAFQCAAPPPPPAPPRVPRPP